MLSVGGCTVSWGGVDNEVESRDTDVYGLRSGEHPPQNAHEPAWRLTNAVPDANAALATRTQARGPPGSVLFFTEALIHSAVQVLSEQTRYCLFIQCTPQGVTTREGWRPAEDAGVEWSWGIDQRRKAVQNYAARI